ncbi:uncharacterized protein STEHIDRAFT_92135 [Stereum hirsutum FP-91666 SS1]|uniref:uncharacterized protein n=1 Tax=Stereum hirsutum (strain FP-91666) TaxID=721885 RepID=UPI000440DC26|nr:uncharacterized protein STEHIDRAFT_92135 [Stereum hirsutum FP-91666 SS1]EIM89705.1 hypothetical protein STEHIDRAFT_92135 [Stereum hirsutum FP-91666 SS1]
MPPTTINDIDANSESDDGSWVDEEAASGSSSESESESESESGSGSGSEASDASDVENLLELGQALIYGILQRKPIEDIRTILDAGAPLWYQDEDGWSCLHAAASLEDEKLIKVLLDEGAVWNAVDNLGNGAGDIALSLNNESCYKLIRDAGLRSELLLQLLASKSIEPPETLVLKAVDTSAFASSDVFLASPLRYTKDENGQEICLLKSEAGTEVGVMMGWEREIMQETVKQMCAEHPNMKQGLKVLNVGFGLGIIDTFFEELPTAPTLHVIIEPHKDVLQHMREMGWFDKPNVKILEGKWQDFVSSKELLGVGGFDAVYTDTFSENYEDLRQFCGVVPKLLAGPQSRFSFFNGLGATNAVFYDVYTKLAELNLADIGLDVRWIDVDVAAVQGEDRWGKTREYFGVRIYRMPIGSLKAK